MKKNHVAALLILCAIFTFSCQKEKDIFWPHQHFISKVDVGTNTVVTLFGSIIDENLEPVEGVKITVGASSVMSNRYGYFEIKDASTKTKLGLITIEKQGYFSVPKTIAPGNASQYRLDVQLLSKGTPIPFDALTGGKVVKDGIVLDFPANSITDASKKPYQGEVNVFVKKLSPDDRYFGRYMPAALIGERENGEEASLVTYGMIAVELEDGSGQKLNVAEDATVKTEFPIALSQISSAPAEIPLWSLKSDDAFWHEEGKAIRTGDKYMAELPHFSFWNWDVPFPLAEINARIINNNGDAIKYRYLRIDVVGEGITGFSISNDMGQLHGKVPSGKDLELFALTDCGNFVKIADLGPYATNSVNDEGDLILDLNDLQTVNVTGIFLNCDGNPVDNGFISIQNGTGPQSFYPQNPDGSFEIELLFCSGTPSVNLIGFDLNDNLSTESIEIFSAPENIDIGQISTCEQLPQYIRINVQGTEILFLTNIGLNYNPAECTWVFYSEDVNQSVYYSLNCQGSSINYENIPLDIPVPDDVNQSLFFSNGSNHYYPPSQSPPYTFSVVFSTELSETEAYFAGMISGEIALDSSSNMIPFQIEFKILND